MTDVSHLSLKTTRSLMTRMTTILATAAMLLLPPPQLWGQPWGLQSEITAHRDAHPSTEDMRGRASHHPAEELGQGRRTARKK